MFSVERLKRGKVEKSTLDHPLEHLVACHQRIEERLMILERAAEHMECDPEEAGRALESVFRYFDTSGALHTADEEESIFPRLVGRLTDEERKYLDSLEQQHREAEVAYERLKQGPANPDEYRALVARFCNLYRQHIASENERLIAAGKRVLGAEDLEAISAEMRRRRGI